MWVPLWTIICILLLQGTRNGVFGAWTTADVSTVRSNCFGGTYHRLIRPAEQTNVSVSLSLLTINGLDIKTQTFSTTGWLTMEWTDSRCNWSTPADVLHVYAADTEVWRPELFIDNALDDVSILDDDNVNFKITKDGLVEWKLPRIFTTHCDVDITYYPFDTQTCVVELTSWAYTADEISLEAMRTTVNKEDLKKHGEWDVQSSYVRKKELQETKNDGTVEKYAQLDFFITLSRKPNYYLSSVILPVLLTSYLNTLVFILPADSGEKVGFILTVLLALAVLLTLVSDSIPSTSLNVCILSSYLAATLCLGVVCCVLTVFILRLNFRGDDITISPGWKKALKYLMCFSCWKGPPGCCCMCCKKKSNNIKPSDPPVTIVNLTDDKEKTTMDQTQDSVTSYSSEFPEDMKWPDVAAIMDHFFFIVMLILTSLSTFTFMIALALGGGVNSSSNYNL